VYPGQTVTYTWLVPARAGPGPNDPSSILWMYHGHYFEPSNVALSVLGGIIITGAGKARDPNTFDGLMPTVSNFFSFSFLSCLFSDFG